MKQMPSKLFVAMRSTQTDELEFLAKESAAEMVGIGEMEVVGIYQLVEIGEIESTIIYREGHKIKNSLT